MANAESTDNAAVADGVELQSSAAVNDSGVPSEEVQADNSGRFQDGFGYLGYRPACLQFLARARWFLVFMCLSVFCHAIAAKGLLAVIISTIERRFGLSSSQTAWIAASYEIAGVPALLIIGYLGSTLRRPVWIGAGLITIGVGLGIYSIPHYAAPAYRYAESGDSNNLCADTMTHLSSNDSSSLVNDRYDVIVLCYLNTELHVSGEASGAFNLNSLWKVLVGCVAQLAERRSLAGELTLSCARPAADG